MAESTKHNPKEVAGRRAADMVESGMTLGLGTGSTVLFTLQRLAERIREEGLALRGVPTSVDTEERSRELGIPLVELHEVRELDLTIDGADEVDGDFNMTKGGGGALLREKVVARMSRREAVVITRPKLVERLGTTFLLPVEVVPFARSAVAREIKNLGADPILRQREPGSSFFTDNGNEILDCRFPEGIPDAPKLELELGSIPGIVETGLFIGLAHVLFIGAEDGSCEVRERGA
jgi:ribose 5-phosphate isomerase A